MSVLRMKPSPMPAHGVRVAQAAIRQIGNWGAESEDVGSSNEVRESAVNLRCR